jgi:hypothetical protein
LFDANASVIEGLAAIDKILISGKLTRTNTGRAPNQYLNAYNHLFDGGWFLPVLNPLADFSVDDWGCFKPVNPRIKRDGIKLKPIKYEHPPNMPVQPFFLRVTYGVWERIAQRHGVAMPELLPQTSYGREFWEWAIANSLPVTITEGAKKTASLLCAGYAAIGLPGIWNFSDTNDKSVDSWKRPLNPWLQSFFSRFEKLDITIAFDSDTRTTTAQQVYSAACRFANKIAWQIKQKNKKSRKKQTRQSVSVKIAQWHPEFGKGIDDVLVQNGIPIVKEILDYALPFQVSKFRKSLSLSYPILDVNQRYLFNGMMPKLSAKIIAIKSPKNTGKTYCLERVVRDATRSGKKVIVLGHRVQLMSHLCDRL